MFNVRDRQADAVTNCCVKILIADALMLAMIFDGAHGSEGEIHRVH